MKIIIVAAGVCCLCFAAIAAAQTDMTAKEERELEELSKRLVRMKHAVDKFANELVSSYPGQAGQAGGVFSSDVRVDIAENEKDFVVKADLPGMDKDKIVVTLEGGKVLKIAGSREMYTSQAGPNVVRQERMEGRFERVVELPAECRNEGVKASYTNGVLEITIPKKEAVKATTVKVNVQ